MRGGQISTAFQPLTHSKSRVSVITINGDGNDMLYILIQHDYHIGITKFSGALSAFINATLNEKHHDARHQ